MQIVLLIARLSLALVFGVAGTAKAADPARTHKGLIGFGVPEKLARQVGWCLPFLEGLVAVALLPAKTAWPGAVAALVLLLGFAAAIGVSLSRGRAPDCNCFGQLHSAPVSWFVFARNLLLAAAAALIVALGVREPGPSAVAWLTELKAGEIAGVAVSIVAVVLVALVLVFLRRVLNQQATILDRIEAMKKVIDEDYAEPPIERKEAALVEGLPVGAPAPGFSLAELGGGQVTLDDLLADGKPVLLLFASPNCFPCKTLLPFVRVWERDYGNHLTVAVLSKGTASENQERVAKYGARRLLLQGERPVDEDYQARWTPAAVLISRSGKIASQMTYGDEAIRGLVNHTVTTSADVPAGGIIPRITVGSSLFKVGEPAPRFSLPDVQGRAVNTEDFLGDDTLLLFWDSGCGFCQAMTGDVIRWEETPPKGAPKLVIIATGKAEDIRNKTASFKSLVLLDADFEVGPMFGSNSTPSAVLIDSEGRIGSGVAVGDRNVMALAGVRKVDLPIASSF